MEEKVKLSPKTILEKKFTKDVKGYNPDEVDEFLDCVISDYNVLSKYVEDSTAYQKSLLEKIKNLEEANSKLEQELNKKVDMMRSLEAQNASWNERMSHIGPSDHVTEENMEYINKINIYEEFLHRNGYKPKDIISAATKGQ